VLGGLASFRNPLGQNPVAHCFVKDVKVKHHKSAFNNPFVVELPSLARVIPGCELFDSKGHPHACRDKHGDQADLVAQVEVKFQFHQCDGK